MIVHQDDRTTIEVNWDPGQGVYQVRAGDFKGDFETAQETFAVCRALGGARPSGGWWVSSVWHWRLAAMPRHPDLAVLQ